MMQVSETVSVAEPRLPFRVVAPVEKREDGWCVYPFLLGAEATAAKRMLAESGFVDAPEVPMESVPDYFESAIKTHEEDSRYFLVVWQRDRRDNSVAH